ncbi:MAG: deoxyribodipyrimidine photolyase [Gemmatimonadales bacterium]|nr:MAG: deoxyribodipyrimidine photolyase [Gemmatimonadales bacterium]
MSWFRSELARRAPAEGDRQWIYVPYDQLTDRIGPLSRLAPEETGVVLVESLWKPRRRPYHRQKLALLLSAMRSFALEQAERGVAVRYRTTSDRYSSALRTVTREVGPLRMMRAAERELRVDLQPLVDDDLIEVVPHDGWLTTDGDFTRSQKDRPPWRMDAFYREVRRRTGILMEEGRPVGGKFSFDTENRERWPGSPPAPSPPTFPLDPLKDEVVELVRSRFSGHPGRLSPERLPATQADAERAWRWAMTEALPTFGPFEDAMSTQSSTLFHTRTSELVNLHRLLPGELIDDVLGLDVPLQSREGFVRQLLGWREFVRHVHERTDGFRRWPGGPVIPNREAPGDAGYRRWRGHPWRADEGGTVDPDQDRPDAEAPEPGGESASEPDGGAAPSFLGATTSLPPAFWGEPSGLKCLDQVVGEVWDQGYSHHITRLMVLSNLATLLEISPRELTDWFWVAYTDAYDWVVEPNVLGMGTFAAGALMTTKPYVSGTPYIDRMSDYCGECALDPGTSCPITSLYWAFLYRHRDRLGDNARMRLPLANLSRRSDAKRAMDGRVYQAVTGALSAGGRVTPEMMGDVIETAEAEG